MSDLDAATRHSIEGRSRGRNPSPTVSSVAIVSSHGLIRHSLQNLLEPDFNDVKCFQTFEQFKLSFGDAHDDAAVLFEPNAGLALKEEIAEYLSVSSKFHLLLLVQNFTDLDMLNAVRAGASGCITHETPPGSIGRILELIAAGYNVWPKMAGLGELEGSLADPASQQPHGALNGSQGRIKSLSPREKEVLAYVGRGLGNKRIATFLGISDTTVRLHMRSIMRKLDVENRSQVVIYALQASDGHTNAP